MHTLFACVLSLAAAAASYSVTSPNSSKGWSNVGAQTLSWSRVDTDAKNFTAVLTNTDRSVLPENNQVLAALVDGTVKTTALNPPSGGWPLGNGFRVNLVQDTEDLNTIYAQSDEFSISSSQNSSSMASYSMVTISSSPATFVTSVVATTATSGFSNSASATSTSGNRNGAVRRSDIHAALWCMLGLLSVTYCLIV